MDWSGAMNRGKRRMEEDEEEGGQQPGRKRPALASVIVEALKVDSLQRLCSSLEPILRRVVSEEVERALAKLGPARLDGRASPKRLEGLDGKNLQLRFRSRLSLPLFTGGKVEGEQGAAIHVVLFDATAGHVVTTGPESTMKLDIVVLEGDFNNDDDEDWTQEEFESHVVKEREGKRPLLTGDLQVNLKEGVGTLGDLTFTDNSSWIRSRKFRLGLKAASGYCEGIRIREAKTEAFIVKDHRGELYKKHYPPALNDEVWRLEKIGKDGSFHKRLNKAGIHTVQDFLRHVVKDPQKLRNILGSGMSNKMWEALMEHAKTCVLSGKLHIYYPEDNRNIGVVFNNIYELSGLIIGEEYHSADSLSENQKVYVDSLVKKAYDNWNQVVEYDGNSLMTLKETRSLAAPQNELHSGHASTSDHQLQLPNHPVAVPHEQAAMSSSLPVGGYSNYPPARFSTESQILNSNHCPRFDSAAFAPSNQLVNNPHLSQNISNDNSNAGLQLSLPGPQTANPSIQQSNLNLFDDWLPNRERGVEDFFSEEEIRMKSNEMLRNEDMQQLLRFFNMGSGQASITGPEDEFSFPSYISTPMPNFDEDRGRAGKAVVGWLKIKAAMRWGIFIRKKAAERRAQIVELDDDFNELK